MKQKISLSMEEETLKKIDAYVSEGSFRNKSHVVEFALNKFIKESKNKNSE